VGLPVDYSYDREQVIAAMAMDKKVSGAAITVVEVPEIGRFELKKIALTDLQNKVKEAL
jgi:3-dehydroquinate synthetase